MADDKKKGSEENSPPSLLEFPCDFPIKVFGLANNEFEAAVKDCLQTAAPRLTNIKMSARLSENNHYIAISMTLPVESQDELDAIYRALSACPQVKMVL